MTRALSIAALIAAGFSLPAFATDTVAPAAANATAGESAALTAAANAEQARKLLLAKGFTNVSDMTRGNDGRWTGTATKGGKTIFVAIDLPVPQVAPSTN